MPDLETQIIELQKTYPGAEVTPRPDGSMIVRIPDLSLPRGWNQDRVTVTFIAPLGYPQARPDCFWADAALRLSNGSGMPSNSALNTGHGGPEQLLWFSYHPSTWSANLDTFVTYARVIQRRLSDPR